MPIFADMEDFIRPPLGRDNAVLHRARAFTSGRLAGLRASDMARAA